MIWFKHLKSSMVLIGSTTRYGLTWLVKPPICKPETLHMKKNIIAYRSRTDIRKNFFSSRVARVWNALPTEVKEARNLSIFKLRIKDINLT